MNLRGRRRAPTPGRGAAGWMGAMTSPAVRTPALDLGADVVTLTRQLCDIESVSRDEERIADAVQTALEALGHLSVTRLGNTVVARTDLGRAERVVLAGHLDTVPVNGNFPSRLDAETGVLHGLGTCDMKGGDAVILRLAATRARAGARRDLRALRGRGDRGGAQRAQDGRRAAPRPSRGRLRDPDGALQRRRRGRLPGHPARRRAHHRRAGPLGALLEGRQRDPRRRRRSSPASTPTRPGAR